MSSQKKLWWGLFALALLTVALLFRSSNTSPLAELPGDGTPSVEGTADWVRRDSESKVLVVMADTRLPGESEWFDNIVAINLHWARRHGYGFMLVHFPCLERGQL